MCKSLKISTSCVKTQETTRHNKGCVSCVYSASVGGCDEAPLQWGLEMDSTETETSSLCSATPYQRATDGPRPESDRLTSSVRKQREDVPDECLG